MIRLQCCKRAKILLALHQLRLKWARKVARHENRELEASHSTQNFAPEESYVWRCADEEQQQVHLLQTRGSVSLRALVKETRAAFGYKVCLSHQQALLQTDDDLQRAYERSRRGS